MTTRGDEFERPLYKRFGYSLIRFFTRISFVLIFRLRVFGREHYPNSGGALICSNHQSFLDPILVGLTCNRRLNYLARSSLFRSTLLKWIITFLDAIPIEREGIGLGGLKETLRRLRRGELVLIFPEGTRTEDGSVQPLKPGFCAVARRSQVSLVPVGIDGAYLAWPRRARLPRPARIHVAVGKPISASEVPGLSDEELVKELGRRIRDCHRQARG